MHRIAMISVHECPLAATEGKERGGINVYVYELARALSVLGWQVDVFTRIQDDINPRVVQVNDHLRVIHLPNGPHTVLSKKEILAHLEEFTLALQNFIHAEQITYEVMHAHYYLSGIVADRFNEKQTYPIPWIITFHTLGRLKQLTAHGAEDKDPPERITWEETLVQRANAIITTSSSDRTYVAALYGGQADRIHVISPGVDTTLFQHKDKVKAKAAIGADESHRIVLAVGRLDPVKGFDVLLYAIKILITEYPSLARSLCVWIVGGEVGERQSTQNAQWIRLKKLQQSLHLETTVRFAPAQSQEKLVDYYNAADVVVMPSHYESFGMVALEALATGTPVIATDVSGITPVLKEFPGGHVVSANNPILLAQQLSHVLESHHPGSPSMAHMTQYDWPTIGKKIATIYEMVLAQSS